MFVITILLLRSYFILKLLLNNLWNLDYQFLPQDNTFFSEGISLDIASVECVSSMQMLMMLIFLMWLIRSTILLQFLEAKRKPLTCHYWLLTQISSIINCISTFYILLMNKVSIQYLINPLYMWFEYINWNSASYLLNALYKLYLKKKSKMHFPQFIIYSLKELKSK